MNNITTPQTATVSDEAVQVALEAFTNTARTQDGIRAALTAAIPHLTALCSLKVPEGWQLVPQVPTFEMAKAAIHLDPKSDLDAKYRSMLSAAPKAITKPVDIAAVRRQVFEEAKEIAFAVSEDGQYMGNGDCSCHSIYQQGATEVYDALCDLISDISPAEPVDQWQDIATAPRGAPTEDAGCRGTSEWFMARPSKKYRQSGASPIVVICRRAWPKEDRWMDNGETYYVPDYFESWMPLPAAPTSKGGE